MSSPIILAQASPPPVKSPLSPAAPQTTTPGYASPLTPQGARPGTQGKAVLQYDPSKHPLEFLDGYFGKGATEVVFIVVMTFFLLYLWQGICMIIAGFFGSRDFATLAERHAAERARFSANQVAVGQAEAEARFLAERIIKRGATPWASLPDSTTSSPSLPSTSPPPSSATPSAEPSSTAPASPSSASATISPLLPQAVGPIMRALSGAWEARTTSSNAVPLSPPETLPAFDGSSPSSMTNLSPLPPPLPAASPPVATLPPPPPPPPAPPGMAPRG